MYDTHVPYPRRNSVVGARAGHDGANIIPLAGPPASQQQRRSPQLLVSTALSRNVAPRLSHARFEPPLSYWHAPHSINRPLFAVKVAEPWGHAGRHLVPGALLTVHAGLRRSKARAARKHRQAGRRPDSLPGPHAARSHRVRQRGPGHRRQAEGSRKRAHVRVLKTGPEPAETTLSTRRRFDADEVLSYLAPLAVRRQPGVPVAPLPPRRQPGQGQRLAGPGGGQEPGREPAGAPRRRAGKRWKRLPQRAGAPAAAGALPTRAGCCHLHAACCHLHELPPVAICTRWLPPALAAQRCLVPPVPLAASWALSAAKPPVLPLPSYRAAASRWPSPGYHTGGGWGGEKFTPHFPGRESVGKAQDSYLC